MRVRVLMSPVTTLILSGLVLFAAHVVGGVTGFGTAILALPLLALLVGLDVGKQSVLILSTFVYGYITLRYRRQIAWRQLGVIIVFAAAAIPLGMWLYHLMPRRIATVALGFFVTAVGLRNLLQLFPGTRAPRWLAKLLLVVGGVVHGAFTTGGPLLVVYADQTLKKKSVFRATLCLMWLCLNAIVAVGWTYANEWTRASLHLAVLGLPFMLAGLIVGERLHHAVSERTFRTIVNITLIVMGLLLVLIPAS